MNTANRYRRFSARLFSALFVPMALLILGSAWYVGQERIDGELKLVQANEISKVVLGVRRLDGEMQVPMQQLRTLANGEAVRRAIEGGGTAAVKDMEAAFLSLIAYNKTYDQVRWIDEAGLERMRVNNIDGHPISVPRDRLQNQA